MVRLYATGLRPDGWQAEHPLEIFKRVNSPVPASVHTEGIILKRVVHGGYLRPERAPLTLASNGHSRSSPLNNRCSLTLFRSEATILCSYLLAWSSAQIAYAGQGRWFICWPGLEIKSQWPLLNNIDVHTDHIAPQTQEAGEVSPPNDDEK